MYLLAIAVTLSFLGSQPYHSFEFMRLEVFPEVPHVLMILELLYAIWYTVLLLEIVQP